MRDVAGTAMNASTVLALVAAGIRWHVLRLALHALRIRAPDGSAEGIAANLRLCVVPGADLLSGRIDGARDLAAELAHRAARALLQHRCPGRLAHQLSARDLGAERWLHLRLGPPAELLQVSLARRNQARGAAEEGSQADDAQHCHWLPAGRL